MPENIKVTRLTLQELKAKQKRFKAYISILSVVTLLALIALFYFVIKSDNYKLLILSGGFSFALLLCIIILKQVEAEIKSSS